jgi:hypothetical protein
VCFHLRRWPAVQRSAARRPSARLLLLCEERSSIPRRRDPLSSPAVISPQAISAPPWAASSPPFVQGQVKPKTATTLAYLGQTLLQSIQLAQHEYINAFGTDSWRQTVRSSFAHPSPLPRLSLRQLPSLPRRPLLSPTSVVARLQTVQQPVLH